MKPDPLAAGCQDSVIAHGQRTRKSLYKWELNIVASFSRLISGIQYVMAANQIMPFLFKSGRRAKRGSHARRGTD